MKYFLKIFINGLWKKNSSLVQLLGLCPVLAVTTNAINAIGLGVATTIVVILSNAVVSIVKNNIPKDIRIPIYIIIISAIVSSIDLMMKAYVFHLYNSLGIFIPLIITNCMVCHRVDSIAMNSSLLVSLLDGLSIGLGATWVMFVLGSIREILGNGTLFVGIEYILGKFNVLSSIKVLDINSVLLLFIFPSGAFLILGFILAGKNFVDKQLNCLNYNSVCSCSNKISLDEDKNCKIESEKS